MRPPSSPKRPFRRRVRPRSRDAPPRRILAPVRRRRRAPHEPNGSREAGAAAPASWSRPLHRSGLGGVITSACSWLSKGRAPRSSGGGCSVIPPQLEAMVAMGRFRARKYHPNFGGCKETRYWRQHWSCIVQQALLGSARRRPRRGGVRMQFGVIAPRFRGRAAPAQLLGFHGSNQPESHVPDEVGEPDGPLEVSLPLGIEFGFDSAELTGGTPRGTSTGWPRPSTTRSGRAARLTPEDTRMRRSRSAATCGCRAAAPMRWCRT